MFLILFYVQISEYRMEDINGPGIAFSPAAWTFQGKVAETNEWLVLDFQSGITDWTDGEIKSFVLPKTPLFSGNAFFF